MCTSYWLVIIHTYRSILQENIHLVHSYLAHGDDNIAAYLSIHSSTHPLMHSNFQGRPYVTRHHKTRNKSILDILIFYNFRDLHLISYCLVKTSLLYLKKMTELCFFEVYWGLRTSFEKNDFQVLQSLQFQCKTISFNQDF